MPGEKTAIQFPLTTAPGVLDTSEGRGRMINCYPEPMPNTSQNLWKRAPGCLSYGTSGASNWTLWGLSLVWFNPSQASTSTLPQGLFRGGIFVNNTLYAVIGTNVYTIASGGNFTKIGSLSGTDKVFLARNNAFIPDIVCVAQAGAFTFTGGTVAIYPDLNVGSPSCVVGHEGFFIFGYGNGNLISSNINTTTINPLNLARTETNPDGVIQLMSWQGQLYAFGEKTIEIWGYPLNGTGFPFNRVGYNLTPGIINDHAVAGFEPEWGPPPIYVGSDNTVRWLINDNPVEISTPDLKRLVTSSTTMEVLVYMADGVPFCEVTGMDDFTWVFDARTDINQPTWYERQSYLSDRSRFTGSVFAFETWLCGDFKQQGRMLEVTFQTEKEVNDPFIATIESLPVEDFPNNISCLRADFELTPGVGHAQGAQPQEFDPQVEISYSNDAGQTWSNPRMCFVGQQSKSNMRVTVWRTGLTGPQGRRWRVGFPSAVHFGIVGGAMKAMEDQY
jgi:hypothetical protein